MLMTMLTPPPDARLPVPDAMAKAEQYLAKPRDPQTPQGRDPD
jgi:hypothetical protein